MRSINLRRHRGDIFNFILVILLLLLGCQVQSSEEPSDELSASFAFSPASPIAGQPVQFTDTSSGSPASWQWSFGDGATSNQQNPGHTYAIAGTFTVSLTVTANTVSKSVERSITISPETPGSIFYIDTGNAGASDTNPGTESLPWKTITKANQTLVAGDTVYIKSGSYSTYIAPVRSGTAEKRITYRAYGSDIVTVQNASYGILLDGRSFVTVWGINFYNLDRFMYLQNGANHNIIAYCKFDQMRNYVEWAGSRIWKQSSHNWIHHCQFSKYGACLGTPPNGRASGVVLEIGNEESLSDSQQTPDYSNYNLVEKCVLFHGGHHVLGVMGRYNIIRNNYLHNEGWSQGSGQRTLYMNGYETDTGWNLIEGNRFAYAARSCNGNLSSGIQVTSHNNIFRLNSFYFNDLAGIQFSTASNYYQSVVSNYVYNNTFFYNSTTSEPDPGNAAIYFAVWDGSFVVKNNIIKNNLYFGHPKAYGVYRVNLSDQIFDNEFIGETSGNPNFVNASETPGDPMNSDYPDLHLTPSSPCINKGGVLTTITSTTGSGTVLQVADANYFTDGWGIIGIAGDEIQLIGNSQRARIVNVNYATKTITVSTTLSWMQGQGIALVYVGSAPDVGAYEYGATQSAFANPVDK